MNTKRNFMYLVLLALCLLSCQALGNISISPTPTSTTGEIKGVIVFKGEQSWQYYSLELWSVDCQNLNKGKVDILDLNMGPTDIKTGPDSTGAFIFTDVPPGCYLLGLKSSITAKISFMEKEDAWVIIEVMPGQTKDLGKLQEEQ